MGGGGSPIGGSASIDLGGNTLAIATGGQILGLGGGASSVPGPHIERLGGNALTGPQGALAGNPYGCPGPDGSLTGSGANFGDATSHAFPGYVLITW